MALQVGSWVQTIGMGWLVLNDLGGSATSLGLVALLRGGSQFVWGPVGGYAAARFERRAQLLVYTLVTVVVAALLSVLVATGAIELWMVFVAAAVAGTADALAFPVRQMLVYSSVQPADLTNAVALNALGGNAMRVIGPALGGAIIGIFGTQGAFQLQAAVLGVAALLTVMLRRSPPGEMATRNLFKSIGAGMAYTWRDPRMRTIVIMALLPSALVYPYMTFMPVFAKDVMGSDQQGYGFLAAAAGVGSLLGGGIVAWHGAGSRMGPRMLWTFLVYSSMICAFTFTRDLWVGVTILAVGGIFHSVYAAMNASLMQLQADDRYRAQVMSLQTMSWGVSPFAGLLMGRMVDHWGAPHVVLGWAMTATLVGLAIMLLSREMRRV